MRFVKRKDKTEKRSEVYVFVTAFEIVSILYAQLVLSIELQRKGSFRSVLQTKH